MPMHSLTLTEVLARILTNGATLRRRVDTRYVLERDGGFAGIVSKPVILACVQKGYLTAVKGNVFGTAKYYLTPAGKAYIEHIMRLRSAHAHHKRSSLV